MPRRLRHTKGASTLAPSSAMERDIPWFTNFGKFAVPGFRTYDNDTGSLRSMVTVPFEFLAYPEMSSQVEAFCPPEFLLTASESEQTGRAQKGSARGPHSRQWRRVENLTSTSEAEEEGPKTLGSIIRRMVSFDAFSKRSIARK